MATHGRKALLFTSANVGGAERVTLTVAKILHRAGYTVRVYVVGNSTSRLSEYLPHDIPLEYIHIRNIYDLATLRIYRVIRRERPDAVFTSLVHLWPRVTVAARLADRRIRVVLRCNIGIEYWQNRINRFLVRHTVRWADRLVMQTDEMLRGVARLLPAQRSKMVVVDNPIDTSFISECLAADASSPFDPDRVNIISTCRIVPQKRIDDLLHAFARVRERMPRAHLTVLGDTTMDATYYSNLMDIVAAEGLTDDVTFAGLQRNLYRYIVNADCFVLPSQVEGYPNSLLEAIYLCTPVVATLSVPVVRRIVSPDRGYVVEVGDITAMSQAICDACGMSIADRQYFDSDGEILKLFSNSQK